MKNKFITKILKAIVIIVFALLILLPILFVVVFAFIERWPWPYVIPNQLSLRGFYDIASRSKELINVLLSSILISLITSLLSVIIAILTARALTKHRFFCKNIIYFTTFLPFMIPATVFSLGIQGIFIRIGINSTITGVIIGHLVYSLPYATHIILAAMNSIGTNLEEQGAVLGASNWYSFKKITLPLLSPAIVSALSMAYIVSFSQYFITLILGGGKIKTFSIILFPYLQSGDRLISSAYSLIFIGCSLLLLWCFEVMGLKWTNKSKGGYYEA